MKWYVYVVECSDNTLYTGITNNLDKRINQHNNSKYGAKYTRSRRPVTLVKFWQFNNKSTALKEEYKFKQLSKKKKLLKINE